MAIGDKKVGVKFGAKDDGIAKRFKLMDRLAARFGRNAEKSFRRASKGASRFSSVTKGVVAGLGISRGLGLVSQGIGSVVTQFIAFDKAALGATVRFKDIGPTATNFNEKLKEIEASARDAGATTEFTAAQAASSLDFLAKAGFTSAEAMGALASMIDLATATGEDFAQVADQSSDLLGAFGLNSDDTTQKIANLNRLNDVLVKTANSANVNMENMFDTMTQVGPIATGVLGASLEEVAALTGVLGNSGIKGSNAMTALKNAYLRLAAPASAARKVLGKFNISMKDATTGGARKMTDILEELGLKIKDIDPTEQAAILDKIFGKRAIAGSKNLMTNVAAIRELEKSLKDAGGTSKLTAEIMRTSLEAKLMTLQSAATEFGFKILEAFRGDAKGGLDSFTESIRKMDVKPLVEDLKIIVGLMKDVVSVSAKAAGGIKKFGQGLGIAAAKFVLGREDVNELDLLKTAGTSRAGQIIKPKIGRAEKFSSSFDEFGGNELGSRSGPNQAEAAAKAQNVNVNVGGVIDVNAPAGTTAESSGPVGFNTQALGAN